jgi:hypothetical protein
MTAPNFPVTVAHVVLAEAVDVTEDGGRKDLTRREGVGLGYLGGSWTFCTF